ncbi:MAG: ATP-binding protein [Pleurocapsa sp.]
MIVNQYPINILIIEDSEEDQEVYRRYLNQQTQFDYQITAVESGSKGLEKLEKSLPDLILLDYLLPDCNGLEFIDELQSQKSQIPPIIMLTGQGSEAVAVKAMKSGVKDYLVKVNLTRDILMNSIADVFQQQRLRKLLTKNQQQQQQQLIAETALRIRQSLNLPQILDTAVNEVRLLLECDRVVIYRFAPDMSGKIVAESVKLGKKKALDAKISDTCFQNGGASPYKLGKTLAINNIYRAGFTSCHLQLLEAWQVKAHIVVPILLAPTSAKSDYFLWGLLIAHQCDRIRQWKPDEVDLLDKLAVQLSLAIQQAELIANLQNELETRNKLESQLARLVRVLEGSEDYIGLANVTGKIIWNNPRLKEIVGITEDNDLTKLSVSDYHPTWALNVVQNEGIPTAMTRGTWIGKTALLTREGKEIPVSQLIIAHQSPQGDVEYISTVMRDLSEQIESEKFLRARADELKWVNRELVKTASLLKKRNQELDHFAYVTSHDLKAPLRAIANLATWLGEDLEGIIPEESQLHLQLMQSRVERLEGLIQGLLDYSRVGRSDRSFVTVEVKDLLIEAIDSLSPPAGIEIAIAPNLPTLRTDIVSLRQVFVNLIDNAIKYHHQDQGKIEISVQEQDNCYEFAVSDDGPGIEPIHHQRIFQIFQTLQPRDTFESTGIGLSIVKKILEERGNLIRVESELGQGATFYFTWDK